MHGLLLKVFMYEGGGQEKVSKGCPEGRTKGGSIRIQGHGSDICVIHILGSFRYEGRESRMLCKLSWERLQII